jgi:hypothetical protein
MFGSVRRSPKTILYNFLFSVLSILHKIHFPITHHPCHADTCISLALLLLVEESNPPQGRQAAKKTSQTAAINGNNLALKTNQNEEKRKGHTFTTLANHKIFTRNKGGGVRGWRSPVSNDVRPSLISFFLLGCWLSGWPRSGPKGKREGRRKQRTSTS